MGRIRIWSIFRRATLALPSTSVGSTPRSSTAGSIAPAGRCSGRNSRTSISSRLIEPVPGKGVSPAFRVTASLPATAVQGRSPVSAPSRRAHRLPRARGPGRCEERAEDGVEVRLHPVRRRAGAVEGPSAAPSRRWLPIPMWPASPEVSIARGDSPRRMASPTWTGGGRTSGRPPPRRSPGCSRRPTRPSSGSSSARPISCWAP